METGVVRGKPGSAARAVWRGQLRGQVRSNTQQTSDGVCAD